MLLLLLKRLQIIVWLLLTFNLTLLFHSTIISTIQIIAVTEAAAATNSQTMPASSSSTVTTVSSSSLTTTMSPHLKRLHLQLEHLQYTQTSYQNYPISPQIATELMEPNENGGIQPVSLDQQPHHQQPNEFTSLTHKLKTTMNKGNSRSSSSNSNNANHMDNNENNIIDINYNSLNGHQHNHHQQNRLHAIKGGPGAGGAATTNKYTSAEDRGVPTSHEEESFRKVPQPYFDLTMPRNITARAGQIAAINCRVENLGDKSVSWIRKRDLHILTAGILTYTSDERFKVTRTLDRKQWSLHIKYAQPRDSGIYECQVNTEPKMSMAFRLNVIVTPPDAKASISGPADLYVKIGSVITLTCHIKQPSSAHDIGPIHWYRGPYILTPFVVHPNEAAIDMQRISMESKLGDKLQSRLRISNAQLADSGNYTCMPTTAEAASVVVNVLNDESPAAMQKSSATGLKLQQLQRQPSIQQLINLNINTTTKLLIFTLIICILIQPTKLQLWQIKNYYYHHHRHHHLQHQNNHYHQHRHHHQCHQQFHRQKDSLYYRKNLNKNSSSSSSSSLLCLNLSL